MGDNSGVFELDASMSANASAGIDIVASAFDTVFDGIEQALNNRIFADGTRGASADIPMNTNKLTNVGDATASNEYPTVKQIQRNELSFCLVSGSTAMRGNLGIATSGYFDAMPVYFQPEQNINSAPTLALNGLSARNLQLADGTPVPSGHLVANGMYLAMFSSADQVFKLQSPRVASQSVAGTLRLATSAEATEASAPVSTAAISPHTLKQRLARPGAIGNTSAGTGTFTIVSASAFAGPTNQLYMLVNTYSSSHDIGSADIGRFVVMNNASATAIVTIPTCASTAIRVGQGFGWVRGNTGEVQFTGSPGVTITTEVGSAANAQDAMGVAIKTSQDRWRLGGSLKAP